ncbi:hypothetical protein [Streptomyces marispadix]|uniref:Chromosome partitioning protein n=1 Tax=Streptomyces marispadix TaxID=2922868 RepID=A0ABS9ST59_9ACTN|nr:hypothetical protein [Streptomyces marispadix]MCH6159459.1 hypothetical protein [Streptomyces marispadix]
MEPELMTLAASGATALVGLMVDEAWTATKYRVAALFGRGRADSESVEAELEESRGELVAARDASDENAAADVEAGLRTRLRRLLREDPDAAQELRSLIAEAGQHTAPSAPVTNTITDADIRGPVIQAGSIEGGINIGGDGRRSS